MKRVFSISFLCLAFLCIHCFNATAASYDVEPSILYDQDGYKVEITGMGHDDTFDYDYVECWITNGGEDAYVIFDDCIMNGYGILDLGYGPVTQGNTIECRIGMDDEYYDRLLGTDVLESITATIQFWTVDDNSICYEIDGFELHTSEYGTGSQPDLLKNAAEVYKNDIFTMYYLSSKNDWGYTCMQFCIINQKHLESELFIKSMAVDGIMVTPLTISDNFGYENQPYMMEVETDESELDTFSGKHVEMSYYYADDPFEYYKIEFDVPAA